MSRKKSSAADEDMTTVSILEYFASVADPRIERSRLHPLTSVLVLSLCAVVCGADSFVAIAYFGRAREAWLKTFLELPNGIPSHDTIGRIFALLDPKALEEAFRRWTAAIATLTKGEVVAIDGKTLRRSFQTADRTAFVHMVSAWAAGNRMVLGQIKTDDKSNEITAIPQLLELLRIEGCLVTIDAMGCQKEIASKIVGRGADYMLGVKDNQPTLSATISGIFAEALRDRDFPTSTNHHTTTEKAHGRTDVRRCWTMDIDPECGASFDEWDQGEKHRSRRKGAHRQRQDIDRPLPLTLPHARVSPQRPRWLRPALTGESRINFTGCSTSHSAKTTVVFAPVTRRRTSLSSATSPSTFSKPFPVGSTGRSSA